MGTVESSLMGSTQSAPPPPLSTKTNFTKGVPISTRKGDQEMLLRGSILGSRCTGKTALFQRLRGEDPFHQPIPKEKRTEKGFESRKIPTKKTIKDTIAWTGENGSSAALVELHDGIRANPLDFAIILIDPMRDETMNEAKQTALDLLNDENTKIKNPQALSTKKVYICFLLNFKDISSCVPDVCLSIDTVQNMIKSLHHSIQSPSTKTKGHFYSLESSMKNCFGLLPLHNFIQVPYYTKKESILQLQLKQLYKDQKKADIDLKAKLQHQDYSKFLSILTPSAYPQPSPLRQQTNKIITPKKSPIVKAKQENSSKLSKIQNSQNQATPHPNPSITNAKIIEKPPLERTPSHAESTDTKSIPSQTIRTQLPRRNNAQGLTNTDPDDTHSTQTQTRKPIFSKPSRNPIYDPNQTLEDFLAEDDDDDFHITRSKLVNSITKASKHSTKKKENSRNNVSEVERESSDENEEDDYYFDLNGQKIATQKSSALLTRKPTIISIESNSDKSTLAFKKSTPNQIKISSKLSPTITPTLPDSTFGRTKKLITNTVPPQITQEVPENDDPKDDSPPTRTKAVPRFEINSNKPEKNKSIQDNPDFCTDSNKIDERDHSNLKASPPSSSIPIANSKIEKNNSLEIDVDKNNMMENNRDYPSSSELCYDDNKKSDVKEGTQSKSNESGWSDDDNSFFLEEEEKEDDTKTELSVGKENSYQKPDIAEEKQSTINESGWSDDDNSFFLEEEEIIKDVKQESNNDVKLEVGKNGSVSSNKIGKEYSNEVVKNTSSQDSRLDDSDSDDGVGFIMEEDDCPNENNIKQYDDEKAFRKEIVHEAIHNNKDSPRMSEAAIAAIASAREELMATLNTSHVQSSVKESKSGKKKKSGEKKKKKKIKKELHENAEKTSKVKIKKREKKKKRREDK